MSLQRCLAATLAVAVVAMLALSASTSAPAQAQEDDPVALVEQFFDELNSGDVEGTVALVSDDFILTDISSVFSFAAVGKPAFTAIIEDSVNNNFTGDIQSIDAEDGTVTGVVAFSDDFTDELGIDRYLQPFVITVEDGVITRGDFTYDEDDPQTAEYVEATEEGEDGEGEEPPGAVTIALAAQPGGNQPGEAFLFPDEAGITGVFIGVAPGAEGVQQPAHFHTGTCAAPGPIVEPLANVLNGLSFTLLSVDMSELVDTGLIINVHLSEAQAGQYVSCGEVRTAAAQPTPAPAQPTATAAAPPAPTPTRPAGIVAPDTGTGGGTGGGTNGLLFALAALGSVAAGAGALRLALTRQR